MTGNKGKRYFLVLFVIVLIATLLFFLCWRYDNKYAYPAHHAGQGITVVDMDVYLEDPFFYPIRGWELYRDKLLSPTQLATGNYTPNRHIYIGQYGGFDLGDPAAAIGGRGTYRMTIFTDSVERDYALELTRHYTAWRLWINGELVQCVGLEHPAGSDSRPGAMMITLRAKDAVEVVVEVEDTGGFYGEMVYPPAFGSPDTVSRMLQLRFLIHAAAGSLAGLTGLLCLIAGTAIRGGQRRFFTVECADTLPYVGLFLLCICFCGSTAYPVWQALGIHISWEMALEQLCTYGIYLVIIWLQGQLCALPKALYYPMCGLGGLVCAVSLVPVQRLAKTVGALYLYSRCLTAYIWLTVAWLLATSIWAVWQGRAFSRSLLAGFAVFAAALAFDRLNTLHEPVLLGWNVEIAVLILIGIVAGILLWKAAHHYRESLVLREQKKLDSFQLAARQRHAGLQQKYIAQTRKQLHETRNHMTVLRHYTYRGENGKAREYLDRLLDDLHDPLVSLTGHPLVDAMVGVQIDRARRAGIYLEHELGAVPAELAIVDSDLAAVLMNLLDNAIEGCERLAGGAARWISLQLWYDEVQGLIVICTNASPPVTDLATTKKEKAAHGHGVQILRETAKRYGGNVDFTSDSDSVTVAVSLQPQAVHREVQPVI